MDELTDDAIAGDLRLLQRRRGHRYSLDDVATAWEAARARPHAARYLDLGCGIGSVLIMVAYKVRPAHVLGVEAQEASAALARENVRRNGIDARIVQADLREVALAPEHDLVTGTPPYLPAGRGSLSTDAQRAYARIELRGGIEDYLAAAARALAPGGVVVACCDARTPARAIDGAAAAGLAPVRRRDVVPRAGHKGPLFSVWTFAHEGTLEIEPPLVARDEAGGRTEAAHALRAFFDLPVNRGEAPSPGRSR
ncbi:MAG: methyltransferase domain-containing protein [Sandaracinaceae bacterium]|nr:methyltransferase domain-containing protein [Sandaracinaceae bacterium]